MANEQAHDLITAIALQRNAVSDQLAHVQADHMRLRRENQALTAEVAKLKAELAKHVALPPDAATTPETRSDA
jgi:cell division protein FtsB